MDNRVVVAYPQPGKARSRDVLRAFVQGAGGDPSLVTERATLAPGGEPAFYGLVGIEHLLRQSIGEDRVWWYGDNAFFDSGRQKFFRFAKSAMQWVVPSVAPDYDRLKALYLSVSPWRKAGGPIVVVEQSEHFLELSGAPNGKHWLLGTIKALEATTDRPLRIRRWNRSKDKAGATLQADLKDAHALVTHMSAAANEALLAGVPVFVSGRCAAMPLASGDLSRIESPRYPDGREEWAGRLAAAQWTLDELRAGVAWRALNG